MDKEKFKFFLKYNVIPEKLPEFKQRLKSVQLALKINPELASEAKQKLIEEYPFIQEFFD